MPRSHLLASTNSLSLRELLHQKATFLTMSSLPVTLLAGWTTIDGVLVSRALLEHVTAIVFVVSRSIACLSSNLIALRNSTQCCLCTSPLTTIHYVEQYRTTMQFLHWGNVFPSRAAPHCPHCFLKFALSLPALVIRLRLSAIFVWPSLYPKRADALSHFKNSRRLLWGFTR